MASDLVHAPSVATSAASGWTEGSRGSVGLVHSADSIGGPMNASSVPDKSLETSSGSLAKDLLELTKPRIVTMILVTTACTGVIGAGGGIGGIDFLVLLIGTGLVAASAGSANQVWERRIDADMARTARRPLPAGRLSTSLAATFSLSMLVVGTTLLWLGFSFAPAAFGLATWASYVFVYTPLKIRTTFNTTVGAVAGALPVMIGYTATGGSVWGGSGWLLFAVLAAWQYPHFMAIAWMYRTEYRDAGFKMTPSVHPDGRSAAIQAIVGSIVLMIAAVVLLFAVAPPVSGAAIGYLAVASVLVIAASWPMLSASIGFARQRSDVSAKRLLRSSLLVLPAVLLVATVGVLF